jgi:mannose-1-phosphate guanylyltransferase
MPIVDRPALEHLLQALPVELVAEVWLATGYAQEQFAAFAADVSSRVAFPVRVHAESQPLGTGGAIAALRRNLLSTSLVLNGDTYLGLDLLKFWQEHRQAAAWFSMAVVQVADVSRYGSVRLDGTRLLGFAEKTETPGGSGWINGGAYLLSPAAVAELPAQPSSLERDVFPLWLAEGRRAAVHRCSDFFLDIGTPSAYLDAQRLGLGGGLGLKLPRPKQTDLWVPCGLDAQLTPPVWLADDVQVGTGVQLDGPVVVARGCVIGAGSSLSNCVLWENCSVGAHCRLENCILGDNVQLPPGTVRRNWAEIADPACPQEERTLSFVKPE